MTRQVLARRSPERANLSKPPVPALLSALFLGGCSVFGATAAEEPSYDTTARDGRIEIRQYGEILVAQTTVDGEYDQVGSAAFRRLADFIFGNNDSRTKVAMTSPVFQEVAGSRQSTGERIDMTTPVLQESDDETAWTMTFVMPAEYTLSTLPRPRDSRVQIRTVPSKTVAALRFSGRLTKKRFDRYSAELLDWVADNGFIVRSSPRSAGYDPPWTLPPLRRNEIQIDVERAP
jgi:effector-binding domain-containing protein